MTDYIKWIRIKPVLHYELRIPNYELIYVMAAAICHPAPHGCCCAPPFNGSRLVF